MTFIINKLLVFISLLFQFQEVQQKCLSLISIISARVYVFYKKHNARAAAYNRATPRRQRP